MSSGRSAAVPPESFQSVRKFGCRSQSVYIISQKQLMMSSQVARRQSPRVRSVRVSTCSGLAVLSEPLAKSLNVNSIR